MNETELENELRALRPAPPSPDLARRLAASLDSQPATVPSRGRRQSVFAWWLERLLWAGAGASAVMVATALIHQPAARPPHEVAQQKNVPVPDAQISEQPLTWTDEGVRFIDKIPARLLRRVTLERHLSADGSVEVQVPREDVIVMPVALR